MSLETFGRLLREYREEQGLNQSTAARRAKVSRHTLINWERGATQPSYRYLVLDYARDVLRLNCDQVDALLLEAFEQGLTEDERKVYFPGHRPATPAVAPAPSAAVEPSLPWSWRVLLWLVLLALSFAALTGFLYLLLGAVGALAQGVALVILATLLTVLSVLEISAQGWRLRALGRRLDDRPVFRLGVIVLFLIVLLLWATAGRAAYCQTYPCGERVVLVEPFAGRDLGQDEVDEAIGLTQARLRQLFRRTRGLNAMSAVDSFTLSQIDFKVAGYYEGKNDLRLKIDLMDGLNRLLAETIEAGGQVGQRGDVEALQKELGRQLLAAIGVPPGDAHAALVRAFALHPDALAANEAGVALYGVGRLAEAQERFREALRIEPDYVESLINLGVLAAAQGRYDEAAAHLQQALAFDPESPYAHYNLGCVYSLLGDWPAAVRAYEQATRRFEGYVAAWNNLGDAYLELGKWRQARAALEKGLALAPDAFYLHKNMGRLALAEGDAPTAIAELKQALEGNPVYSEAQFYLARAYAEAGEPAAACEALVAYGYPLIAPHGHQTEVEQLWQELDCLEEDNEYH
jgi:tetratricopeptide (TPR) repeat protein/DNA-binding XRE family transcriptional regulator